MEEKLVDRLAAAPVKKQEKMGSKQEKQGNRETGEGGFEGDGGTLTLWDADGRDAELENWKNKVKKLKSLNWHEII